MIVIYLIDVIINVIYVYIINVMEYIMFKIKQCNNKIDEDHSNYS